MKNTSYKNTGRTKMYRYLYNIIIIIIILYKKMSEENKKRKKKREDEWTLGRTDGVGIILH